jgi:hypothetical protein
MPDDGPDNGVGAEAPANDWQLSVAPAPREPMVIEGARPRELPEICTLKVGGQDERGNTVKYIYSCDRGYVIYYSRLEHRSVSIDADRRSRTGTGLRWLGQFRRFIPKTHDLPYESEGVQAQLSPDPTTRTAMRRRLLPLGTERAKLQALLNGWPRRQSYDSSIIGVAISPAKAGRVWTLVEASDDKTGLYRSDDYDARWTIVSSDRDLMHRPWLRDKRLQGPSPMHEVRHRPSRRNPRKPAYCETGRPLYQANIWSSHSPADSVCSLPIKDWN